MPTDFMKSVQAKTKIALASGDLQPLKTEQTIVHDAGIRFILRWASTLANKDDVKSVQESSSEKPKTPDLILPGGPRDPNFNHFLKPDPALLLGDLGSDHAVILNKFPVCLYHLVIARKEFAEQLSPLELTDFQVLAVLLNNESGLGFYNGGAAAGASQRHKHVQWLPPAPENASLAVWLGGLPISDTGTISKHLALPLKHCFFKIDQDTDDTVSAKSMLSAYEKGLDHLSLKPDENGLLPAHNMLISDGWMLLVPRSKEHFQDISLNAPSFGGTIYVREKKQIESLQKSGPISALADVSFPA